MKRKFLTSFLIKFLKQVGVSRLSLHRIPQLNRRISEPWAVRQRWRAITANATSIMPELPRPEDLVQDLGRKVLDLIAWAYGQPPPTIDGIIHAKLLQDINAIIHDAHQLSLLLKRDILSAQMTVSLNHRVGEQYDPQMEESVWPEMGLKAGDTIVGVYGFGLRKVASNGESVEVIKPKVITSALLREVARGR